MPAIWKGSISFGLVTIPVTLYSAVRREELKFRLLRKSDLSPVNYKRVAEADGKEVPWDEIVKGYEYEKDKFVVLKDDDFKRVDIEATQTVDIINFVNLKEVDPLLFNKPYYMEVGKGGDKAYTLLRDALEESGKIAISKVVIKTRQHLAAIRPEEDRLMLELMHFPAEILPATDFKKPAEKKAGAKELNMAQKLIESMTVEWNPEDYQDDYKEALEKVIEDKIEHGDKQQPVVRKKAKPSNVIDLAAILQQSIKDTESRAKPTKKKAVKAHRKAA
ncbi:MAG: Ku protein [Verrucomicrobia bacterium]|jgi:DNA end-binding protein Ku|nr:Ku protein [Verrucomicrobiota bacterium]